MLVEEGLPRREERAKKTKDASGKSRTAAATAETAKCEGAQVVCWTDGKKCLSSRLNEAPAVAASVAVVVVRASTTKCCSSNQDATASWSWEKLLHCCDCQRRCFFANSMTPRWCRRRQEDRSLPANDDDDKDVEERKKGRSLKRTRVSQTEPD